MKKSILIGSIFACAGLLFLTASPAIVLAVEASSLEFATQSVFLSQDSATQGTSVRVYASIVNASDGAVDGRVVFKDAGEEIGSVSVSLSAGEARIASISWQPEVGSHTITATLLGESGAVLSSSSATAAPKITVSSQPKKNSSQAAVVESSEEIEKVITDIVPQASGITGPVFKTLDSVRANLTDVLNTQLAETKPKLPSKEDITSPDGDGSLDSTLSWLKLVWWTLYYYLLTILHFVIGSAAWFYPIFAFLVLWGLYRLYRKMSEPRFSY